MTKHAPCACYPQGNDGDCPAPGCSAPSRSASRSDDATKIHLTAGDMKALLSRAREAGTVDRWCDIACDWMASADAHIAAIPSELTRSVAVKDMEIIGHREPGDAHKGRAWWSGGTWLEPGDVVAVLTLPKQDERPD